MEVFVTEMIPGAECVSTGEGLYKCDVQPQSNIINSDTIVGLHQLGFINTLVLPIILLLFLLIAGYRFFVKKKIIYLIKILEKKYLKLLCGYS